MKYFLTLLSALLVLSCAKPPRALEVTPIAPTVTVPVPTKPVDLTEISRAIKPVTETNTQLATKLADAKRTIFDLNGELGRVDASRMATLNDWNRLKSLGAKSAIEIEDLVTIRETQAKQINELELSVATKNAEVAAAEQEKLNLRRSIIDANTRITGLTDENKAVQASANQFKAEVDVVKGSLKTEVEWKWRFFWWGSGASLLILLYIAYKLYKPF